jgi:RNA polymerase sigma factor (sigma-70 family)
MVSAAAKQRREHETALIIAAQAGDITARNDLVMLHKGWCHKQANYWSHQLRGHEFDDLLHFAVLGLMRSVDRFDVSNGFTFLTYAAKAIQTEIKLRAFTTNSVVYIPVKILGTDIEQRARKARSISSGLEKDRFDISDGTRGRDAADSLDASEAITRLRAAIETLDPRVRSVIRWRLEERTQNDIGIALGVSKQRVKQLELLAIKQLRALLIPQEQEA